MKIRALTRSLGFQLVAIILLSFMVPTLILGIFSGTVFFRSLEEKTQISLITGTEHAAQLTMNNIERIITLAKDVTYDGILTNYTAAYESGAITRYDDYYSAIRTYLDPKFGREAMVQFAAFYRLAAPESLIIGRLGQSQSTAEQANIFKVDSLQSVQQLTKTLDTNVYFYANDQYTYLIRNLFNMRLTRFGVLVLGVDMQTLLEPLYQEATKWHIEPYIALSGFVTEGAPDFEQTPLGISNQGQSVLLTGKVKGADLTLYYQLDLDRNVLYEEVILFQRILTILLIMLIPIIAIAIYFIRRRILKPVHILSTAAAKIQKGKWGVTVPMHGQDELGRLGSAFSEMSIRLKDLIENAYLKEIALRDAKIQALQSRINPHFLNNALEMINWQARMDDAENVSEMVEALSVLVNAAMDRDNERLVPLKQELEIANAYFYFVSLRFGEKLTIDRHIQESTLALPVPRLVIQTLLENANEHGIAPAGGGHITLNVFDRFEHLVIEVINTGERLSSSQVRRIQDILLSQSPVAGQLGLSTTAHRLRLIYEGKASVKVSQGSRGETIFTITLPLSSDQTDATNATPFQ